MNGTDINSVHRSDTSRSRTIRKHWVYHFLCKYPTLKVYLYCSRDVQWAKNKDPHIIRLWFQCVQETREEYSILDEDTYNFDKTGFAMGLARGFGSSKVITSSESIRRTIVI